jgi:hypothetical protein
MVQKIVIIWSIISVFYIKLLEELKTKKADKRKDILKYWQSFLRFLGWILSGISQF